MGLNSLTCFAGGRSGSSEDSLRKWRLEGDDLVGEDGPAMEGAWAAHPEDCFPTDYIFT